MINMPLFKCCLLAALSVLSCVGAVAPSTTPDAFDATATMGPEMSGRALGAAPASPKDCAALSNETTCNTRDNKIVTKRCSGKKKNKRRCTKLCRPRNRKFSANCKEACCPSSPSPPPPGLPFGFAPFDRSPPPSVPATVKLHDLDPQWRYVHGYWQGTCVDIDTHGDGGTPYTRHAIASTSGSE